MDREGIKELGRVGLILKEENLIQKKHITVATHNEGFHPDDMLCVGILEKIYGKDNISVIRSRDPEELNKADYILDVGKKDEIRRDLEGRVSRVAIDHHQEASAESFYDNGIKKSAIGKFVDYLFQDTPERENIHRQNLDLLEYADNRQSLSKIHDEATVNKLMDRDNPYSYVLMDNIDDKDTREGKDHKIEISSRLALAVFMKDAAALKGEHDIESRESDVIGRIIKEKLGHETKIVKAAAEEIAKLYADSDMPGCCNAKNSNLVNEPPAFNKAVTEINIMIENRDPTLSERFGKEVGAKLLENGPINTIIGENPQKTKLAVRMIQDFVHHNETVNFFHCIMDQDMREREMHAGAAFAHPSGQLITYEYGDKISRAQAWARGMAAAAQAMEAAGLKREPYMMSVQKEYSSLNEQFNHCQDIPDRAVITQGYNRNNIPSVKAAGDER